MEYRTEFNDAETADLLDKAADFLKEPGQWAQGSYVTLKADGTGYKARSACALGALRLATGMDARAAGDHAPAGEEYFRYITAEARLEECIKAATRSDHGSVIGWNDEPGRTQRQVVSMFQSCANKLRRRHAEKVASD